MQTSPTPTQKTVVLPQTLLGRLSLRLLALFGLAMVALFSLAASGQTGGETFLDNLWLASAGLIAAISVISSGVLAALAVVARGERAILSYATMAIGLFAAVFIAGEFLSPH